MQSLPHPASASSSASPEEDSPVDDRSGPVMPSREEPPLLLGRQACRVMLRGQRFIAVVTRKAP